MLVNISVNNTRNRKRDNRACFLKILGSWRFLAKQNITIRGKQESTSNFYELNKMQTESNHDMQSWIQKKNPDKYVSVQVQNDALKLT